MSATKYTQQQLEILRHALGLRSDGTGRPYRSHFVTGPGSSDYDTCESLVACGAMTKRDGSPLSGGDPVYFVTEAGSAVAKAKGGAA